MNLKYLSKTNRYYFTKAMCQAEEKKIEVINSGVFNPRVLDPLIGWLKLSRHHIGANTPPSVTRWFFFFAATLCPTTGPVYFKIDTDVNWRLVDSDCMHRALRPRNASFHKRNERPPQCRLHIRCALSRFPDIRFHRAERPWIFVAVNNIWSAFAPCGIDV